ncbi:MAG: trigger factor [Malacoplasma sp.]|nr:trigger factor [Malacoplasma sp.]
MKILSIRDEANSVVFEVSLDKKVQNEILDREILNAAKNLKVPGYRPGKMPFDVAKKSVDIRKCFDKAVLKIKDRAEDWIVEQKEFLDQIEKIYDFGVCDFQINKKYENKQLFVDDFVFDFHFPTYQKFSIKDIKDFDISGLNKTVTDKLLNDEINKFLEQNKNLVPVERKSKLNDMLTIDFKGFMNDKLFDGGTASNYELLLGSKKFVDNFEEQLVDLKAGDKKTVNVTFPKDYHVKEMQNQKAKFEVLVKAVYEVEIPKLDDKFIKSLDNSEFKDVDSFKKYFKKLLQDNIDKNLNEQILQKVGAQLIEQVPSSYNYYPPSLIQSLSDSLIDNVILNSVGKLMPLDEFLKLANGNQKVDDNVKKNFVSQYMFYAINTIKIRMVAKLYVEKYKITLTDSELQDGLKEYNNKISEKLPKKEFEKEKLVIEKPLESTWLKRELLSTKLIEFIKDDILKRIK